jgi:deazaflavin-dependent oxidoreductase (nitroreductase family)
MAAPTRGALIELFWKLHPTLYRWTGGRIGGRVIGLPVLLLETHGRRTGALRTNALTYFPHERGFVVVASFLGEPHDPAWWKNLRARPEADVQVGSQRVPVRARESDGEERATLWRMITTKAPDYAEYQSRTSRRIPVVVLERA